ncbi:competence type IV pilus minor pilin ComGF [Geobacillus sp. C56-T2]|uniref:competence type IV pilus minor pilin ComGF n=1 Tax=Geobacillus sp. C56-T2 TaxID=600773 RepID=UPI0011A323B3|nr:competence type IV pilus minor pilin ComGF [Geobacillus sp. C56-T2]NNV05376.1 competence protein ComGF [Geobacillus sp. MMMUD3]
MRALERLRRPRAGALRLQQTVGTSGFTLIEALISLLVAIMITAAVPLLLSARVLGTAAIDGFSPLEWRLFLQQLRIEMNETERWSVDGDVFYLQKWSGETVRFLLATRRAELIRQVNGAGYETALRHVRAVSYRAGARGLFVTVVADDGTVWEAFVARAF